jgi:hypothetical protein
MAPLNAQKDFSFEDAALRVAEAAIRNEEAIATAACNMQAINQQLGEKVRTLPDWITTEVDRRLTATVQRTSTEITAQLTGANDAAKKLQVQYERAAKFALKRIAQIALVCFGCGCLGMILGVYISARLILPASDILQRQQEAEQAVAKLAPRGGNSILQQCTVGSVSRLCVRTDESGGSKPWGSGSETYRLIFGY